MASEHAKKAKTAGGAVGVEKTYKDAGVDLDACDSWLDRLKVRLPAIGGFSGLFPLAAAIQGMKAPQLVAGSDGVGTKVLVARAAGDLSTVGIDCVAMVVNDLLCCGAKPLFFLDYLAVGRFDAREADAILDGLIRGCEESDCVLLGGETAELPGLFRPGDFDVAGFGVGVVDGGRVVDGASIVPGDVVIGLASSGLHSNGFSLARRLLPEFETDRALAREMLVPTIIYVRPVLELIERGVNVKGIAHITGAGLPGNLCRVLPPNVDARLDPASWKKPPIYERLAARMADMDQAEVYKTFNMGIGLCLVVPRDEAEEAMRLLEAQRPSRIGEIVCGKGDVHIEGIM